MDRNVSPYLEQPLRTLEEALRQRAAGEASIRGDRGRPERAPVPAPVPRTDAKPFAWRWSLGESLYMR